MWLTDLSIRRRVTIAMVILAFMALGLTQLRKMPIENMPNIDIPIVTVVTVYPGAGPEEVEQKVTKPIEDAVATVSGVDEIDSTSQENVSAVVVRFDMSVDVDVAAADVTNAVNGAQQKLPDEAEKSSINKLSFSSFPVITVNISGERSPRDLRWLVDQEVVTRFGQVTGVAAAGVTGGQQREVQVLGHDERLRAVGLSIGQLAQIVAAQNLDLPAGSVKQGTREYAVRSLGRFQSLHDLRRLQVSTPLGGLVRLQDLAEVHDTVVEPTAYARLNGRDSVSVSVYKQTKANTVLVSRGVRATIADLQRMLPKDLKYVVSYDSAESTMEAIRDVAIALVLGALLAAFVTFVFLHRLRVMLIVAMAIPTSILCTFFPISLFGFTINTMTMLSFSLAVGILVDDSIVVIENIVRHLDMGEDPKVAALNGRAEIGGAAVAITMVDVVVYVPVALMGGIIGRIFFSFGITTTVVTLFSLFMSFTLTPMLASWWFSRETQQLRAREERTVGHRFFEALDAPYRAVERAYRGFLARVVRHPWAAVAVGYGAFVGAIALTVKSGRVGFEFFPTQDTGIVQVSVEGAPGTRLEETDRLLRRIEKVVADAKRYPEVEFYNATSGSAGSSLIGATGQGGQYGTVAITLKRKGLRKSRGWRTDEQVIDALRLDLAGLPSFTIHVSRAGGMGTGSGQVQLALLGPDREQLESVGTRIVQRLRKVPGLRDAELSAKPGRPEIRAEIDRRRAADLGLNASTVAMTMRAAMEGDTSSKYREGGDEYDLRVELAELDRSSLADVGNLLVGLSSTGQEVRLRDVARVYLGTGPSLIERRDRQRMVTVTAQQAGLVASKAQAALLEAANQEPHPGIRYAWAGTAQRQRQEMPFMLQAMALAGALVFMVTAALYANLLQPFNVAFTIPLGMGGGFLGLLVFGDALSMIAMIGLIQLMGMVGKNAILVVDYTNTLRARGLSRMEALLQAGPTRMRPILMTSFATVLGAVPVAFSRYIPFLAEGSELRAPMGSVVIAGMLLSTLLSLLMTPSFYVITDDLQRLLYGGAGALRRVWQRLTGAPRAEEERP